MKRRSMTSESMTRARNKSSIAIAAWGVCVLLLWTVYPASEVCRSWLFAALFWTALSLGCLVLAMTFELTGGHWMRNAAPAVRGGSFAVVTVPILIAPILFGYEAIYPWARAHEYTWFLKPSAFMVRSILYLAGWLGLLLFLRRSAEGTRRKLSAAGLVFLVLSGTFASVDWLMSLDPKWHSSLFGLIWLTGGVVSALSLAVLLRLRTPRPETPWQPRQKAERDLGNLLLASIATWIYLFFMQYLIIWSGNLPKEITWFLQRAGGGWTLVITLILVLHFALPFPLLLSRRIKQAPVLLGSVGLLVLLARAGESFWSVTPAFRAGFEITGADLLSFAVTGGIWTFGYTRSRQEQHHP